MRQGRVNLKESFCHGAWDGECLRRGHAHQPLRPRQHLQPRSRSGPRSCFCTKAEIRKLAGLVNRQGYTLIPLKVYLKDGRMKLELGLCRGKQLHDKRDAAAAKRRAAGDGAGSSAAVRTDRRPIHGGVLVSTGVFEGTVSEPRPLYRATTGTKQQLTIANTSFAA